MAPSTRSKTTKVEKTASNGDVAKTVKTVEKKQPAKRKATDEGTKSRKPKKVAVAVEAVETEEKPKAPRVPTKASAQRIPKELDPARQDADSDDEEDAGILTVVEKLDPEPEDVAAAASTFEAGQDVGKIPKKAKKAARAAAAAAEAAKAEKKTGVIYIGRIPHGFYEHEIRQYLSQFGPVLNVRLSRNKKTGASKHFAFVEFEEYSTAETVVKTMDNYLLFGHILKLRMIPEEDVHEDLFKGANKRFKPVPWAAMRGKQLERPSTEAAWEKKVKQERSKRTSKAAKLKAMGYDFEVPELKAVPAPAEIVVEEAAIEAPEEVKAIEAPVEVTEKVEVTETPKEVEEKVTVETTRKTKASKKTKRKSKA